jgi:hypothetical protein
MINKKQINVILVVILVLIIGSLSTACNDKQKKEQIERSTNNVSNTPTNNNEKVITNINTFVIAKWLELGEGICLFFPDKDGKISYDNSKPFFFSGFKLYKKSQPKHKEVEKFMDLVNNQKVKNNKLKSYYFKGLILILEFNDGTKISFDGYLKEKMNGSFK